MVINQMTPRILLKVPYHITLKMLNPDRQS